jgi:hypothetical protein
MTGYIGIPNNSYGVGSNNENQEAIPIRDLDTENERLNQIVEVRKGESHRLHCLLGEGLLRPKMGGRQ